MTRKKQTIKDYPKHEALVKELFSFDPSKGSYGKWMAQQIIDKKEKKDIVKETISSFHNVKNKLPKDKRDIQKYKSLSDLKKVVEENPSKRQVKKENPGYEKIATSKLCDAYLVKSYEGMKALGTDTKWCVTTKCNWDDYTSNGDIFIVFVSKFFPKRHPNSKIATYFNFPGLNFEKYFSQKRENIDFDLCECVEQQLNYVRVAPIAEEWYDAQNYEMEICFVEGKESVPIIDLCFEEHNKSFKIVYEAIKKCKEKYKNSKEFMDLIYIVINPEDFTYDKIKQAIKNLSEKNYINPLSIMEMHSYTDLCRSNAQKRQTLFESAWNLSTDEEKENLTMLDKISYFTNQTFDECIEHVKSLNKRRKEYKDIRMVVQILYKNGKFSNEQKKTVEKTFNIKEKKIVKCYYDEKTGKYVPVKGK